jgi:murein DD-endopeptidase MepM/ murein hydrolase activator NlpD
MSLTSVSKPASAGEGKLAVAKARAGFVNIRTGPGVEYTDIGDIMNMTHVVYYPNSKTNDWVWIEQYSTAGWVANSVIEFEEITEELTPNHPPTPYDGQIAVWHWKGQSVPENTIDELARNIKRNTPNVKQIWVKVADGDSWQGEFDSGDMAVNGLESIDYWVETLARHGLEFHAWVVLRGIELDSEADIIIRTCQRPGVKSMILDVEPYVGYWEVGKEPVRPLMTKVRKAIGSEFHIGLGVDPRSYHYSKIYPEEWLPFVNSVHMMCYWTTFQRDLTEVLEESYRTWGGYGRPLIPILQGAAPVDEQREAQAVATQRFGAKAISWWRYGVIGDWTAVNTPIGLDDSVPTDPTETPPPNTQYGKETIIFPGKSGYRSGTYTGQQEFVEFQNAFGWQAFYTSTESKTSKVWAEWKTELPEDSIYQIAIFVPTRHATTRKARYKIHGIRGTSTEVIVDINQSNHRGEWVTLGIFDLVKDQPNAGKVFLNDVTGESGKEIAFDAIRLRQIIQLSDTPTPPSDDAPEIVDGVFVADGYDSPIGTADERSGARLWPSGWRDASPFGQLYFVGTWREAYHTGADLNWGAPYEDKGLPVYSCASGTVVFAAQLRVWGNVIVIKHDPLKAPTGRVMYSRYGHIQNIMVTVGDRVKRGSQIAEVGDAFATLVPHLHFDLSPTTKMETNPADWPGKDATRLFRDYVDPLEFTKNNRP